MGRRKHKQNRGNKKHQAKKQNKQTTSATKPNTSADSQTNQTKEERNGEVGVIGLTNLANTCYFNSVLQMLLSSSYLQEYFSQLNLGAENHPSKASLTSALMEIFQALKTAPPYASKKNAFKPNKAIGAVRSTYPIFKGKGQHDAHELLMVILQCLVEEEQKRISTNASNFQDLYGMLNSVITCTKCGYTKSKEEEFVVITAAVVIDEVQSSPVPAQELPNVVEREPPQYSNEKTNGTPPNCIVFEDSKSNGNVNCSQDEEIEEDESFFFNPEWFDLEATEEANEAPSENDGIENVNCDGNFTEHRKRKGKKKKKKGDLSFDFDKWSDHETQILECMKLKTVDSCLERFFTLERVTWRCAQEYPEKRVSFSDAEPEVFVLPPLSRKVSLTLSAPDEEGTESSESEDGLEDLFDKESTTKLCSSGVSGLKSCLKKSKDLSKPQVSPLNSTKQYVVSKLPKILCIHLKRFELGRYRSFGKLDHKIQFDLKMDLNKFSNFQELNSEANQTTNYELKAIVCHSGSMNFGHYTAYVSRMEKDSREWYDISDSDVRKVPVTAVLKSQAYILLYEAVMNDTISESGSQSDSKSQS